jgi:hypothetical protein
MADVSNLLRFHRAKSKHSRCIAVSDRSIFRDLLGGSLWARSFAVYNRVKWCIRMLECGNYKVEAGDDAGEGGTCGRVRPMA